MRSFISNLPDPRNRYRWNVRLQPDSSPRHTEALASLLREFTQLGDAGAFISTSVGTGCVMKIVEEHIDDGLVEALVHIEQCDLRYGRPLRNIVFGLGEILRNSIVEVRIGPASPDSLGRTTQMQVDTAEVLKGTFYPEVPPGFATRIQKLPPVDYHSGRRLQLQYQDKLPMETAHGLVQLVRRWGATMVSAYPNTEEDLLNGQSVILNAEGCLHDEFTFEVLIDRFFAAEAAFTSLLNLLIIRSRQDVDLSAAVVE